MLMRADASNPPSQRAQDIKDFDAGVQRSPPFHKVVAYERVSGNL
jgi:hypothetical protein